MKFTKANTPEERKAINQFLDLHNQRGKGSTRGYVAYYAAVDNGRLVAAAKFCPLHTPQAAKFFGGADWRHVYCLQRLAAYWAPKNLLSKFLAWCLHEMGKDPKVWYVATYADANTFDPRTGQPHSGSIYRAANAVYCGMTKGKRIEAYIVDGVRRSVRCGPKTVRLAEIPPNARLIRAGSMHRYCWAVGPRLKRAFRRRALTRRMAQYAFEPAWQPRLLSYLRGLYVAKPIISPLRLDRCSVLW